jgi:multidrug efflux system outer membrane protein
VKQRLIVSVITIALLGNIAMGQKKPPAVQTPDVYRGADAATASGTQSFGDLKWFEVFKDDRLQELIRTAVAQNYDVGRAVARINEARARLGLARSEQFPNIGASADVAAVRIPKNGNTGERADGANRNISFGRVLLNLLTFEIDLWGRVRNTKKARAADLAATEEDRNAVLTVVVSSVATAYLQLRELDLELDISRRTLTTRQESLRLIALRANAGVATTLDLRQAEQLVFSAAAAIPDLQRRIEQQENFIGLLLGQNPAPVLRGRELTAQDISPTVPPGLPSSLLQRRPDIRSAEQTLIASNFSVAAARAAYFPLITLDAFLGGAGNSVSGLFSGVWGVGAQLSQPIFTFGRIKSNVRLNRAQEEFAIVTYQSTVQGAFREVSDALIAYKKNGEVRVQQEALVVALQDRARLAYLRYTGGVDSLLNALDADRDLFDSQLALAQIRLDELTSVVELYRALGGGWQQ